MIVFTLLLAAAPPPKPAPAPPPPAVTKPPTVIKAAPKDAFDFDLLDKPKAKSAAEVARAEEIDRQAKKRRLMLTIHTVLGYTLMGVASANLVLGALNYHDRFGGGGYTDIYDIPHLISSMTTTAVFATNGILAIFAPDPWDKPGRWDSARWHRLFMIGATAGMVAEIVLGFISARGLFGHLEQRDVARAHLIIGTATYALTMAGGLTYLF